MREQFYSDLWMRDKGESWDYRVDVVRESLDEHGLKRQQRLNVATYPSQGEAEEHQVELDQTLAHVEIEGLGDLPDKLREQDYETTHYFIAVQPEPETWLDLTDEPAHLALIAYSGDHVSTSTLASGDRQTLDRYATSLEDTQALQGDDLLLEVAHNFAVQQGQLTPDAPLFRDKIAMPTLEEMLEPVQHVDASGTKHWFAVVPNDPDAEMPYELRYFREHPLDGEAVKADSYPVIGLESDDPKPQPLPILERYLNEGDVFMAQQFAHDLSTNTGGNFPELLDIPALNPEPEYYFGYGVGPNNQPALEAVKTWMDGAERRFDALTLVEHATFDAVQADESRLEQLMAEQGLERAMHEAEMMAETHGYLDIDRSDPRLFFEPNAPDDPFETLREIDFREYKDFFEVAPVDPSNTSSFAQEAQAQREANATLEGAYWFEATVDNTPLLQPLDDTVNYAIVLRETDPWTLELMATKFWRTDRDGLGMESMTINSWDSDDETAYEQGEQAQAELLQTYDEHGLEAMMRQAELSAIANNERRETNPRLFREGPPDRFETSVQQDLHEDVPDVQEVDNPHWRFDSLPIHDPEGETLGVALQMVRYPTVEAQPHIIGAPSIPEDAPFEMLEMAHFPTRDEADVFVDAFVGYVSEQLTASELAEEVARGQGLPVAWKTLDEMELKAYQDLRLSVTRDGNLLSENIFTDYNPEMSDIEL